MAEVENLERDLTQQSQAQDATTRNLESNLIKRLAQLEQKLNARLNKIEGRVPYSKS